MSATRPTYLGPVDMFDTKPVPAAVPPKPTKLQTEIALLIGRLASLHGHYVASNAFDGDCADDVEEMESQATDLATFIDGIFDQMDRDCGTDSDRGIVSSAVHDCLAASLGVRASKLRDAAEEYGPHVRSVADEHGVLNKRQQGI